MKLAAAILVMFLLVGCEKQTDELLPTSPSRYWDKEMQATIESLSPDEKQSLTRFMERRMRTTLNTDPIPIPAGTTVKQAIQAQKVLGEEVSALEKQNAALTDVIRQKDSEIRLLKEFTETKHVAAIPQSKQTALNDYGVPELERQLQISVQKDKQDPRWREFQTDSPITAAIRARLLFARRAAEQSAR